MIQEQPILIDINKELQRPLADGTFYDTLIPPSTCKVVFTGNGMTDYSVKQMAEMVYDYAWHTEALAPYLDLGSLPYTCLATHHFCYTHLQYKADEATQYLRAPACSWHVRHEGLDCKSYTIFASSILLNLGIKHYIRRVRQADYEPDRWSHVYVVVPKDQKTANLDYGYYVVDGTVATPQEGQILEKSDVLIMKHVGLAGTLPQGRLGRPQGLNGSFLDTFKGWFSQGWSPSCIGGTLNGKDFNAAVEQIVPWFSNAYEDINDAVADNSPSVLQLVNRMFVNTAQIADQSMSYSEHKKWSSSCSQAAADAYKAVGKYYMSILVKAFTPWLEKNFNVTYGVATVMNNTFEVETKPNGKGFEKSTFNHTISVKTVTAIALKSTTTTIQAFAFEAYSPTDMDNFNANTFLQGLDETIATFGGGQAAQPNSGTVATAGNIISNATGIIKGNTKGGTVLANAGAVKINPVKSLPAPSNNVSKAGFGTVTGIALGAIAAGTIYNSIKKSKQSKPSTK